MTNFLAAVIVNRCGCRARRCSGRRAKHLPLQKSFGQCAPLLCRPNGMTLLETLVAIVMLVTFTGVVAMVMEFSLRFLGEAESGERNEFEVSNGVLIDHQNIELAMDELVEVLAQPGLSKERLEGRERCPVGTSESLCAPCPNDQSIRCWKPIAFDPAKVRPAEACPLFDPVAAWGLPISSISLPPSYRFCLWTTSALEASQSALLSGASGAKPGIYLLQALPERLNASTLPVRRLFCRPRPFC